MKKAIVVVKCEFCDGEAYVHTGGEYENEDGSKTPIYLPCAFCKGTGEMEKRISLREFQQMLDRACSMEVDWKELAEREQPVSHQQDSRDAAGI
jgi:hypothetical protein